MGEVAKADPAAGYPPEEGCYLRGNDYSPVAVVVVLRWQREETPPEIEALVRAAVESGAALAGTLQTENIGIEKLVCNVVANPNIRYLVVCGPESPGHLAGQALLALARNGVDEQRRVIGTDALTPYLFNVPTEFVERFRKQVTAVDLVNEGSPEVVRQAVWSCYQEQPTAFRGYELYDTGAYPEPPLAGTITWRVTRPQKEPKSEADLAAARKLQGLMGRVREAVRRRAGRGAQVPRGREEDKE